MYIISIVHVMLSIGIVIWDIDMVIMMTPLGNILSYLVHSIHGRFEVFTLILRTKR